jgi:tetratricopeptide (TPR) repeat protein
MRWRVLAFVAFAMATMVAPARADDKAKAREHFSKGSKAFDLGAYDEAIAEYSACYRIIDDPAILYNIAQSHRLAGHSAEALRFYRLYLIKLPAAPNRDEVESKIAELQKAVEQLKKTQNMPPDQVKPVTQPGDDQASKAPPRSDTVEAHPATAVAPPAPGRPNRTLLAAGGAVGGVGLGAVVAGIALSVLAKQASDDLTALNDSGGFFDPAKQSAGKAYDVAGPVLMGIGGAAVVAGVVLIAIGARRTVPARAGRPSSRPTLAASTMGLGVSF